MIKYIHIENYKSIKKIGLSLSNLNLFFGMNGMGKSSTIQALLLCRQSYWKNGKNNMDKLFPNGELIELGTNGEVFCSNADKNEMAIHITFCERGETDFRYTYDPQSSHANFFNRTSEKKMDDYESSLFLDDEFVYISAEHLGPQRKYEYSKWDDNGINRFGNRGEYAIPFLAMNGDNYIVPDAMYLDHSRTNMLIDQVTAWMEKISPGVRLNTELLRADQEARLKISYNESWLVSDSYSPLNVGFGIPYVLPLIIAILSAKKGSLILIENPESHLHPKGQTAMAELMACAASYGVQIICESHSDHIINGARVAIKEKKISKEDVSVVYYSKDEELNTKATHIQIDNNGNLDRYPIGLLDEWGDLMSRLI
jgi:Uncharacterized conserved protein